MADHSAIEWTDASWNPVRGCTKVSAGCKFCYAERFAERFRGVKGHPFEQGFDVRLVPEALDLPLRWKKPRRVFVNSMSDLFHEDVPDRFIADVFNVMKLAPEHTFQVLTKRPERMAAFVRPWTGATLPLPNVWLGVSVEDQAAADERIPHLLATPAAVRFGSCEPLLGPVDLAAIIPGDEASRLDALSGYYFCDGRNEPTPAPRLDWAIVGGESGPGARRCDVAWIRSLLKQCKAAGVPCFVKQLGAHVITRNDDGLSGCEADDWQLDDPDGQVEEDLDGTRDGYQGAPVRVHLRDRKGGDPAEWPADLRVREYPKSN